VLTRFQLALQPPPEQKMQLSDEEHSEQFESKMLQFVRLFIIDEWNLP
jgi:hypothetical protein